MRTAPEIYGHRNAPRRRRAPFVIPRLFPFVIKRRRSARCATRVSHPPLPPPAPPPRHRHLERILAYGGMRAGIRCDGVNACNRNTRWGRGEWRKGEARI